MNETYFQVFQQLSQSMICAVSFMSSGSVYLCYLFLQFGDFSLFGRLEADRRQMFQMCTVSESSEKQVSVFIQKKVYFSAVHSSTDTKFFFSPFTKFKRVFSYTKFGETIKADREGNAWDTSKSDTNVDLNLCTTLAATDDVSREQTRTQNE